MRPMMALLELVAFGAGTFAAFSLGFWGWISLCDIFYKVKHERRQVES